MLSTVKIDENVIVMQAFVRIIKKCYENKGVYRDPKAVRKIRKALVNPEHYCRLDIDPNKVFADYEKLGKFKDITEFNPASDIDVQQLEKDILNVVNGIIDSLDDFGDMPFINAGKWLEMINDKVYGYYQTGHFGEGRNDDYYVNVLDEQMKIYNPCDDTNNDSVGVVDIEKITQEVKEEIYKEVVQGLPKAFEKAMSTNIK